MASSPKSPLTDSPQGRCETLRGKFGDLHREQTGRARHGRPENARPRAALAARDLAGSPARANP